MNVKRGLAGFRVGAEQWMADSKGDLALDSFDLFRRHRGGKRRQEIAVVIDTVQVLKALLKFWWKAQITRVTVREQCVAANRRDDHALGD